MKIYIRAVTIEELEKKYLRGPGMTKDKFKSIYNLDPTGDYDTRKRGKYAPWLFKQYQAGNLDLDRDRQNIQDTLGDLADRVRSRAYQQRDINQYKTVEDLIDAHRTAMNTEVELTQRQQVRNAHKQAKAARNRLEGEDTGDITELATDGTWTLYRPNTWAGDIALAMVGVDTTKPYTYEDGADENNLKATWCTAGESINRGKYYYDQYTAKGPLYVFIDSTDPIHKYQTNLAATDWDTSWFFNWMDREQGERAFFDFLDKHPNFKEYFRVRDENGVKMMGDTIRGYTEGVTEVIIPEGVTSIPSHKFPESCISVVLPDSLTKINDGAFKGTNVETITFNNVTVIGKEAFADSQIRDIDLSNVDLIDNYAFQNCPNLLEINTKPSVQLGAYAFANSGLSGTFVQRPETLVSSGTFTNCANLTIVWEDDDCAYTIDGIRQLRVDMATHPQLVEANENYIDIANI